MMPLTAKTRRFTSTAKRLTVEKNTETYLGVNYWYTPFNGLSEDLYIYNGITLTDDQVTCLFEGTTVQ